ncbi:aminoglycoside phosphotransferase family protein [Microlunatus soli]|uniref:Streptomycin 6-kinase n=1 Tax=Microlunatus soli TaxID=630515 RepID=A0A1H1RFD4_9ACTN|nr:aminoglycoside phosphotransferase family protein [Microlunatus soli]SDS34383.1 streptomycin 6-kinase [Microlunatus soli]
MSSSIPAGLLAKAGQSPDWADWLERLPKLIKDLLAEWSLTPDGAAMHGAAGYVLPVSTDDGASAVLKISFPHPEAEHEHLALRSWAGHGAIRLLRADPHRWAMLLERADSARTLDDLDPLDACREVADLYARLHIPAIPQLRRLSEETAGWADRLRSLHDHPAVPRRLIDHAASLASGLATDPQTDGRLIHTDLHFDNVLGSRRAALRQAQGSADEWLAIDPKPLSGDPHYEVAPLLWNRWDEIVATGNVRNAILDRIYTVVDHTGLDEDRVRDWVLVRELVNVLWALADGEDAAGNDWVTMSIVIAKAAQR